MTTHKISFRVYYEDTDVGGIVYHPNYLKFAERARTEWLRELGFEQSHLMEKEGIAFIVSQLTIIFHAPAKLDDLLTIETSCKDVRKVALTMEQKIKCDHKLLATLSVTIVCINEKGKPAPLPVSLFPKL